MELGGVQIARDCPLSRDDVIVGKCDVTTQTELLETSEDLSKCVCVCACVCVRVCECE